MLYHLLPTTERADAAWVSSREAPIPTTSPKALKKKNGAYPTPATGAPVGGARDPNVKPMACQPPMSDDASSLATSA